jgi:L-threonylcarbamoyladenylate synthase
MTADVVEDGPEAWSQAIETLEAGGVVALPTDTVYGICVSLGTPGGVERLFSVKRRPADKGIMLLLDDARQAEQIGILTTAAIALGEACWPGGLTVVVTQRTGVVLPSALTARSRTIGLRVPDHPTPRALARGVGPLPTTSANVSGFPEARDADEILEQLGEAIDLIIDDGPADGGPASTVVDCTADIPHVLRVGAVSVPRLAEILDAAGVRHELAAT